MNKCINKEVLETTDFFFKKKKKIYIYIYLS